MKMGARLFEKLSAMQVTLFKIKPLCGPGVPFSRLISPENTFEAKKLGNETDAKNSNDGCSPKDLLGLLLQDHRKCRLNFFFLVATRPQHWLYRSWTLLLQFWLCIQSGN